MPELIEKRTRNSKTHSLGEGKFSWDGTIGSIHYEDNGWQEIDNYFEPAVAPWDWQMLKAGYHIRVKEDFTAGQIIEFEVQGETVQFQPMALEWTNDLDQIQQISMPHEVAPVITNPEVDLLPAVGMPSHQGTIRWDDAYGEGIDFEWKATSSRLNKTLEVENLNKLPIPQQYILDGGNPVLRLNLIFDPPSKQNVDIVVDGQVWNQQSDIQTFKTIEFVKDDEVLWGFMPLKYWGSYDGNDEELLEANYGQSVATLEKRGNKLYISIRVPYEWLQSAIYPVFIDTDIVPQPAVVGAGNHDAKQIETGAMALGEDFIRLKSHAQDYSRNWGGFLWTGIALDQNTTIDVCYIEWECTSTSFDDPNINLHFQEVTTPAVFTTASGDITNRAITASSVPWVADGIGVGWSQSDSLVDPLQEVLDGRAITAVCLIIRPNQDGTKNLYVRSWEYASHTQGAKLHIEYTVAAPAGQPYISRVQGVQGMRSYGGI